MEDKTAHMSLPVKLLEVDIYISPPSSLPISLPWSNMRPLVATGPELTLSLLSLRHLPPPTSTERAYRPPQDISNESHLGENAQHDSHLPQLNSLGALHDEVEANSKQRNKEQNHTCSANRTNETCVIAFPENHNASEEQPGLEATTQREVTEDILNHHTNILLEDAYHQSRWWSFRVGTTPRTERQKHISNRKQRKVPPSPLRFHIGGFSFDEQGAAKLPRKPRSDLKPEQLSILEQAFASDHMPSRQCKLRLAGQTGISLERLQQREVSILRPVGYGPTTLPLRHSASV
ncbi:ATP synthase CF1 beta subunit [Balamuthia mandrillaris]